MMTSAFAAAMTSAFAAAPMTATFAPTAVAPTLTVAATAVTLTALASTATAATLTALAVTTMSAIAPITNSSTFVGHCKIFVFEIQGILHQSPFFVLVHSFMDFVSLILRVLSDVDSDSEREHEEY
jgi:hypothetical protein